MLSGGAAALSAGKAIVQPGQRRWLFCLGEVIGQWRSDFEDEQIEKLAKERRAELADLKAEFDRAGAEAKTTLKKRIDEARASAVLMSW